VAQQRQILWTTSLQLFSLCRVIDIPSLGRSANSKLETARLRAQAAQGGTQTLDVGNGHLSAAASVSPPLAGGGLHPKINLDVTSLIECHRALQSPVLLEGFLIYTLNSTVMAVMVTCRSHFDNVRALSAGVD
jgi:hypothetical protein